MEKDLEKTLLKRYEEAKALEKKKKRDGSIVVVMMGSSV
jgi:hypothetical protein